MQLNLTTAIASPNRDRHKDSAAFGAWRLYLHPPGLPFEARILLTHFNAQSQETL